MRHIWYDVAPRYTCGSPALVDQRTAERVAQEECEAYQHRDRRQQPDTGLLGIAWCWFQRGNQISWRCLITGQVGTVKVGRNVAGIPWPWRAARQEG